MPSSTEAAEDLANQVADGMTAFDYEADDWMGATDCPHGCRVEPDGTCPHGYLSAALTLGVI